MEQFDVIIVGGGPAGLKCAEELGKTDLKVLLLEKAEIDQMPGRMSHTTDIQINREPGVNFVFGIRRLFVMRVTVAQVVP